MRNMLQSVKLVVSSVATVVLFSGCAIGMKVPIKDPVPSTQAYRKPATAVQATALEFKDVRDEARKAQVVTGRIPMNLVYADKPFEAVPWLATHVVSELTARGLPVRLAAGGTVVQVSNLQIVNHRATGFSPFVTFTLLQADVSTARGTERITSYYKRGKVPVWGFEEVIDPTYNEPLGIATKEIAAKLNQVLLGQSLSDQAVDALVAKIDKEAATSNDAHHDVYQLGFSNNLRAVGALVKLSTHANEYVRLAAISSLGILKAQDQFDFLIRIYESKEVIWQDRAMALKAVGDLGGTKSRAYLEQEMKKLEGRSDNESTWTRDVIKLYR